MANKPFKLFTTDIVAGDEVFTYDDTPELRELVEHWRAEHKKNNNGKILEAGGKTMLTKAEFDRASPVLDKIKEMQSARYHEQNIDRPFYTPGGSSANTTTTMSALLGADRLNVRFLGLNGGKHADMIDRSFAKAKVNFESPQQVPANAEAATSVVVKIRQGEQLQDAPQTKKPDRIIFTYAGNVDSIMTPQDVMNSIKKDVPDAILVQGSLRKKMNPEVTKAIVKHCHYSNTQLWLAAPTQAHFTYDEREELRYNLPSATVFLSNDSELKATLGMATYEEALQELQRIFKQRVEKQFGIKNGDIVEGKIMREPVAMITRSDEGCDLVFAYGPVVHIPAMPVGIINSLGAGDTSYAGFLSGWVLNQRKIESINQELYDKENPPNEVQQESLRAEFREIAIEAGRMAMGLASQKMLENTARLDNPKASLYKVLPDLAKAYHLAPEKPPAEELRSLNHWGALLTPDPLKSNPFAKHGPSL